MAGERTPAVELDDGATMVILAQPAGMTSAVGTDTVVKLSSVASSIERVSLDVLDAVCRVEPGEATGELGFGPAIESGRVVALLVRAR